MRMKIQNTNENIRVQEKWTLEEYIFKELKDKDESGAAIIAAQYFLEAFPRFKEIVLNTELTEDVQASNKD